MNSACDCPSVCPPEDMRRRRSFDEMVDESEVYHVTAGPFIFKDDKKDKKGQEKDENEKTSKQGT